MFTGLIETIGTLVSTHQQNGLRLTIQSEKIASALMKGDSVAVNGVCLTVVGQTNSTFTVEVMPETVRSTTLSTLSHGHYVNLERAMQLGQRLAGHWVQGHVDGTGIIQQISILGNTHEISIACEASMLRYIIQKGSIAVNGVSLTIIDSASDHFRVGLIPHTFQTTTFSQLHVGNKVNLEVDMIAKYVEKLQQPFCKEQHPITSEFLYANGF